MHLDNWRKWELESYSFWQFDVCGAYQNDFPTRDSGEVPDIDID